MAWPSPVDFRDAVQTPQQCFETEDLAQGTTAVTPMGMPLVYSGNFACVFKVTTGSGDVAVRCFTREVGDQQERYGHLSDYLKGVKPEAFVGFEYVERGIRVKGHWYPIVRMDWAEGDRLDKFVADHIDRPGAFLDLAARWRGVNGTLRGLKIAHNDLQHGNVMVQEQGALHLVDYDGIFLPRFDGQPSPEVGHRHYQHPMRSSQDYHAGIDNFPSLVVYLSLLALMHRPPISGTGSTTRTTYSSPGETSPTRIIPSVSRHCGTSREPMSPSCRITLRNYAPSPWSKSPTWKASCCMGARPTPAPIPVLHHRR